MKTLFAIIDPIAYFSGCPPRSCVCISLWKVAVSSELDTLIAGDGLDGEHGAGRRREQPHVAGGHRHRAGWISTRFTSPITYPTIMGQGRRPTRSISGV